MKTLLAWAVGVVAVWYGFTIGGIDGFFFLLAGGFCFIAGLGM